MKKLFLFAMAAVALASCSESDELALSQAQQEAGRGEVAFSWFRYLRLPHQQLALRPSELRA